MQHAKDSIPEKTHHQLLVCRGTGCESQKAKLLYSSLQEEISKAGLSDRAEVIFTGCRGLCQMGPTVLVEPEGTFYCNVKPQDAAEIVDTDINNGGTVERLLFTDARTKEKAATYPEIKFFDSQRRVVLRNCGFINPESIDDYLRVGGYQGIMKALTMTPEQVIDEVKQSGLRGRGGGGFPTGTKWELCSKSPGDQKYLICNADEGDPGAFMDRAILEGDPHSVLEGMLIAGYAMGASKGYIYVRAEYALAHQRSFKAIQQATEKQYLGPKVCGSDFSFDIEIKLGAGAFVCGEETALIASIEGRRGMPTPRPPFPVERGLFGKPTNINNVETLANVPVILTQGSDSFSSIGTEKSKGTKVYALAGRIACSGLVEVPVGTPLRTIVEDIGRGIPNKRKFKAAQTGGPSGGCIPVEHFDIPMDYENLTRIGSIMGSGGLIIMDETTCMVDLAKFFLGFTQRESCGKCVPCRLGTKRMLEILTAICKGESSLEELDQLIALAEDVKAGSLCGLGQTAPNPVLSTIRYFRDEYEAHILRRECPARVCVDLVKFQVNEDVCKKCGACFKACPSNAITWQKKQPAYIDREKCIKCRSCIEACRFHAID
jgi:NADH:ubiquinone oxidoreductase subunit F (NADH-binding)/(2Fe-2S) ferredoxin/Pyruvate/2-oxoacid:ferredoxin oxidoreductase delta subunit